MPPRKRPGGAELYEAVETFLRAYQSRDRDRPCYGDISISECHGLDWIVRNGPAPVNELAAALLFDKSGASRIARSLERKGYIQRRPNARDQRSVLLASRPAGRRLVARIRAQIVSRQEKALQGLPAELARGLPEALRRLAESVARPAEPALPRPNGRRPKI